MRKQFLVFTIFLSVACLGTANALDFSPGKTGAAYLCSEAALRCGAGLVTLGTPESLNSILEHKLSEVMTLPLPESSSGCFSISGLTEIMAFATSVDGLLLGPGMGLYEDTEKIVREMLFRRA